MNSSSKKEVGTHYLKGPIATHTVDVNSSYKKAVGNHNLTEQSSTHIDANSFSKKISRNSLSNSS